tara:strand:- start:113 stop:253 length:141 start_codon:yes stop_codon:yes gene_type:complete
MDDFDDIQCDDYEEPLNLREIELEDFFLRMEIIRNDNRTSETKEPK